MSIIVDGATDSLDRIGDFPGHKQASKDEIRRTVGLLFRPGDVHELRVVGHRLGVIAGFYDGPEKLAEDAHELTEGLASVGNRWGKYEPVGDVGSVYLTLNPVKGHKLALAGMDNRFRVVPSRNDRDEPGWLADDGDIVRRRLILLDFDPCRGGQEIASTDAGWRNALQRAADVRCFFQDEMVWPTGLLASSGNGGHDVFACDLPNDDEHRDLIRSLLHAVASRFGDNHRYDPRSKPCDESLVDVDTSVFNASRIVTVYGTWKRKGANRAEGTPDNPARPHRLASIIESPEALEPVPVELIRRAIEECRATNTTTVEMPGPGDARPTHADDDVDGVFGEIDPADLTPDKVSCVVEKLRGWGLTPGKPIRRGVWTRIPIGPCLFHPEEHPAKATIGVHRGGAIAYGCFGGRCSGQHDGIPRKTWRDVRAHFGDTSPEEVERGEEPGLRKSPGGRLVEMALAACELVRSVEGTTYARVASDGHRETMALDGMAFHDWLCGTFYEATGATAKAEHVRQAIQVLRHRAMKRAKQPVHLRFASSGDRIYWDLGGDRWDAIEISKDGWRIVPEPPVVFRRTPNTAALPMPERGGSMDELRPFFGSTDEGWMMLKGAILAADRGEGPYFVVSVHGEQGSAKSWTCRFPKRLLDPVGAAELDRLPRDEERWATTARNEYLLAFDNVSRITDEQSDTLCRLATGGGEKRRKLYTDDDQVVFDYKRPVFLNGIPDFTERPDLLDRSLTIQQPVLEAKKSEKALESEWAEALPRILGGVLDLLVTGLRRWDETPEPGVYRMADAVRWVTACLGDDSFERAYRENREAATEHGLACSPLAPVLMQFLDSEGPAPLGVGAGQRGRFRGTAEELHRAVLAFATAAGIGLARSFPERPNTFSNQLRRDAAMMRGRGVDVRFVRVKGERIIDIRPLADPAQGEPSEAGESAYEAGPGAPSVDEEGRTIDYASHRIAGRPRTSDAPGDLMGVIPGPLSAAG